MNQKKIMLCDDSMLIRIQLKNYFESHYEGITIFEASNGREAIELYRKEKPNLVLMDIVMPDTDGVQCLKEIIKFDKDAKIIVLSSVGNQEMLRETIKSGAVNFIQKPWSEESMSKAVELYI